MEEIYRAENADEQVEEPVQGLPEDAPQLIGWWDKFWTYMTKMKLTDMAMRVGSALMTIGLIGLVVWVMKGFFVTGEMVDNTALAVEAGAGGELEGAPALPAYEGVMPVEGLSRSAESHTAPASGTASRYDFEQYEVKEGDTVWDIAESFGLKPETILYTNLELLHDNPAAIYPGVVLNIPPVDGVLRTWVKGDGLRPVAEFYDVEVEDIVNWPTNNLSMETIGDLTDPNIAEGQKVFIPGGKRDFIDWTVALYGRETTGESPVWGEGKCDVSANIGPEGSGTYIWPTDVTGVLGYDWGPEVGHYGVDLGGGMGSPIRAVDNGIPLYVGWSEWGYGNVIVLDHGSTGMQTIYAHLDSFAVGCGDFVYQGDVIGYMGSTGNSSGPHLHFEIRSGSTRLNPHNYIFN